MRIGITCYPTYGGSGVVATELGIELAALGHEVHFISYSQPFRLSGRDKGIHYHEVPVSSYPLFEFPPYDLALASRMAEVAEFYELDLLHVHYAIPHSVSALLARQMLAARGRRLPFVTTLHGTDITLVGLDRSYLPITRYAIQESDGVTSISNYLKDEDDQALRRDAGHRGDCELRQLRRLYAHQGRGCAGGGARAAGPARRGDPDASLQLQAGQARGGRGEGLCAGGAGDAGAAGAGGRRAGPLRGRVAGARPGDSSTRFTSWASRSGSTSCCRWPI